MSRKGKLRKARALLLQRNREIWRKKMPEQKPIQCDEVLSPRRSPRSPMKTPVKKRALCFVDDEQPSTSKGPTTLTPVKVKKRKLSDDAIINMLDVSDVSDLDEEEFDDDPEEQEQTNEEENINFIPYFKDKKNSSSDHEPSTDEVDLNSFEILDLNGANNEDKILETIYGTEVEILDDIFNRSFDNNENKLPAIEENLVSPAGFRDDFMDYRPDFVEDLDDETFICSKRQINYVLNNSNIFCSKCESSNLEFKLIFPQKKKTLVHGISFYCRRCKKNLFVGPSSERVILPRECEAELHGEGEVKLPGEGEAKLSGEDEAKLPGEDEAKLPGEDEAKLPGEGEAELLGIGKAKLPEEGKAKKNWAYKTSIRYAIGTLCSGVTYQKGSELTRHLGINPLSHSGYLKQMKQATSIINKRLETMKDNTAMKIVQHYRQKGCQLDNGVMDIVISFDGTWMSRGRCSKYGVAFVVEAETGLILDAHLSSNFCLACTKAEKKFRNNQAHLNDWKEKHKANCDINYDLTKSSGQMEAEAARILFGRSLKRNLRYSTIISDEDSSTYKTICNSNPYEGRPIKKINCLNHISKKIFRKLEDGKKKEKLGGKGIGKITQNTSLAFSMFYGFAIKKYLENFEKIRESIFATIDHHISTDDKPLHTKCSVKYCKYKLAQEKGINIEPDWHKNLKNRKYSLSEKAGNYMKTIFKEMTTDEVLGKVSGKTQNMNESIHSKLWNLLPKVGFRGAKHVQFCLAQTCLDHNYGKRGISIVDHYGMSPGKPLIDSYTQSKAQRRKIKTKKSRKVIRKEKEKAKKDKSYVPGGFAS